MRYKQEYEMSAIIWDIAFSVVNAWLYICECIWRAALCASVHDK